MDTLFHLCTVDSCTCLDLELNPQLGGIRRCSNQMMSYPAGHTKNPHFFLPLPFPISFPSFRLETPSSPVKLDYTTSTDSRPLPLLYPHKKYSSKYSPVQVQKDTVSSQNHPMLPRQKGLIITLLSTAVTCYYCSS